MEASLRHGPRPGVTATVAAAQSALTAAQMGLASALSAAGVADAALWACLHSSSSTSTVDEGTAAGGGGDEYCDYTTWYDDSGDITEVDDNGCYLAQT